jgi:radical SAM superfamily enzyme YgiQ (UPF0313 family)
VPELLLKNSEVDAVCAGEGEKVIVDLLRALVHNRLEELVHLKGFYFKTQDGIVFSGKPDLLEDLDRESTLPAYDLLPMDIYLANPIVGLGKDVDFISSRGCPFQCTFCYQPWGRRYRAHSVDFIIDGLRHLTREYGIDFVSFQDDEFMAQKRRVYELCEKIQKHVRGLRWSCTGRANLVDDDAVRTMKDAGCVSISYGFESGSPRMLASMKKSVMVSQMENALKVNRKYGMMVPVSFIIGMPGEDEESCRETVEFCVRNNIPLKSMMFATPYPGTEIFEFALSTGRIHRDRIHEFVMSLEDARDFTVNLTNAFSDGELVAKRAEMIQETCARVKAMPQEEYREKMKNLFGDLAESYLQDASFVKHRAEHGGIDLF